MALGMESARPTSFALSTRVIPRCPVIVVSDLPVSFLKNRLPAAGNSFRAASFDVGMVQLDSVRIDLPATLRKVEALYARREVHTAAEVSFLKAGAHRARGCRYSGDSAGICSSGWNSASCGGQFRLGLDLFGLRRERPSLEDSPAVLC